MTMSPNHNAGPTRVALFVPSLQGGGAERSASNLAGGMAARGIAVDMVLARAHGPYLDSLSPDVNVVDLDSSRVLFALPGLIRYLQQKRPPALTQQKYSEHEQDVIETLRHDMGKPEDDIVERNLPERLWRSITAYRKELALFPGVKKRGLNDIAAGNINSDRRTAERGRVSPGQSLCAWRYVAGKCQRCDSLLLHIADGRYVDVGIIEY